MDWSQRDQSFRIIVLYFESPVFTASKRYDSIGINSSYLDEIDMKRKLLSR